MDRRLRLSTPPLSARVSTDVVASTVMKLVASGAAVTKADIVRTSGLARTTVDNAFHPLLEIRALRYAGIRPATGRGRPAEEVEVDPGFGVVLVADCGVRACQLAVFDFGQNLVARRHLPMDVEAPPDVVVRTFADEFLAMLREAELDHVPRIAVIGLPAPVDQRHGSVVRPPLMPAWDGFGVVDVLGQALGCEVVLENDVNLRAVGEQRALPQGAGPLIYLKFGTGIGCGLVTGDGSLLHGADGAAGDIGHIRVVGSNDLCVCGNRGCLEAHASLRALAEVHAGGRSVDPVPDFLADLRARTPAAVALLRERAPAIGEVVVSLVHVLNPDRIVIGGQMASASDDLLATVRSVVYQRSLPLATRNLTITGPALGEDSGVHGALVLGLEAAMEPDRLGVRLATARSGRRRR